MYKFNRYSWMLFIVYWIVAVILESHSPQPSMEGMYSSFPIIILLILWSEKIKNIITIDDSKITKKEAFKRDLFLITCGFTLASIFPLAFEYNNSDVLGWWSLGIVVGVIVGFVYAFVCSLISMMVEHHKKQIIILILFIATLLSVAHFAPKNINLWYASIPYIGDIELLYFFMGISILIHLFFCLFCVTTKATRLD